jgi:hypothetical protein
MELPTSFAPEHNSTGTALLCHPGNVPIASVWSMVVQYGSHRLVEGCAFPVCLGREFPRLVMDCLRTFVVQIPPGC